METAVHTAGQAAAQHRLRRPLGLRLSARLVGVLTLSLSVPITSHLNYLNKSAWEVADLWPAW